ncbi:MAG TPA: hypothetical protein PLW48_03010 [Alphaproteobacteria bacterium]|nr:hypothetical protein [Alphaproteobacteria bacterium]HCS22637.1 hypothetical protein [Rhodospirillaceae bacterium]HRI77024.1 hypothetical protein [Alphaproteobacteria bacterium]HRJ66079.1 hypothetical protein [Alphaproteobacteria bacterium]
MGQLDKTFNEESYETRELAWELQQPHPDQGRVRFFLENAADLRRALSLANIEERDLQKKPALRPLHLQRHLHA